MTQISIDDAQLVGRIGRRRRPGLRNVVLLELSVADFTAGSNRYVVSGSGF